ncbi:glycosyltransferase family 52 [Acinetobacter radioresistens]|uniref:glycosyltransferase family 52 n=1 Tax=Acinetobacter radioresistens TaxID=40216 RepID=UPI0011A104A6|nr:glycosyltransferase family 52 [Acinetobacter radioresistens]
MTNLIVCMTPLQTLIAKEIIFLFPDENFDLIYVSLSGSPKDVYYYELIKGFCDRSFFIREPASFLEIFLLRFFVKRLRDSYFKLYLANIERKYIHLIASRLNVKEINTFDDGVGNIIRTSVFYSKESKIFFKRLMWKIIGVNFNKQLIRDKAKVHYTIYNNIPNIIENLVTVSLFPENGKLNLSVKENREKVVTFYLGQPLTDIDSNFNMIFVERKLSKIKIDYYFPHPREIVFPKGNFQVVESLLIFEDYIINFLKDNPNVRVEVYSFISSALLNVSSLLKVQCIYLYNDDFMMRYKDFYFFSKSKFNIKLKNVESI